MHPANFHYNTIYQQRSRTAHLASALCWVRLVCRPFRIPGPALLLYSRRGGGGALKLGNSICIGVAPVQRPRTSTWPGSEISEALWSWESLYAHKQASKSEQAQLGKSILVKPLTCVVAVHKMGGSRNKHWTVPHPSNALWILWKVAQQQQRRKERGCQGTKWLSQPNTLSWLFLLRYCCYYFLFS